MLCSECGDHFFPGCSTEKIQMTRAPARRGGAIVICIFSVPERQQGDLPLGGDVFFARRLHFAGGRSLFVPLALGEPHATRNQNGLYPGLYPEFAK